MLHSLEARTGDTGVADVAGCGPVVRRSAARVYGYGLPFPRAYGYVTPAGAPLRLRLRAPGERGVPAASFGPPQAPPEAWARRRRGEF